MHSDIGDNRLRDGNRASQRSSGTSRQSPCRRNIQDDRHGLDQEHKERMYIRKAGYKALFSFTTQKHVGFLVGAVTFSVIAALIQPGQAILFGLIFNKLAQFGGGTISQDVMISEISKYISYLVALGCVNWISNGGFFLFWFTFGELQAKSARDRMFHSLLHKDLEWYDMRRNGVAALLPRVQMQIRELQIGVSQPLGVTISCIISSVTSMCVAFYYCWNLTLVILSTVPIIAAVMAFVSGRMEPNVHMQGENLSEALKHALSAFSAIETVKCFNGQDSELWKYAKPIRQAAKYYLRQTRLNAFQTGFMQLATLGMFVQGFWYGSTLIDHGEKTPGQIMTCFWAALEATSSFAAFLPQLIVIEKGRIAGAKLRAVMAQMQSGKQQMALTRGEKPSSCHGDIDIKEVTFAYPARPNQQALVTASLFFPAGETTFVIGKSGSGKSTIGQLILRFYDPNEGSIRIDGNLLKSLDVHWVRSNITLVEQTSMLFNDTVFRNIALGRKDYENVTLEEAKEAAQFALLQEVINDMPEGYHTVVGSKGNSVSGGQRQRIALARSRLRDTPVLILDESTSALDYINRSLILEAIRTWRRGKTTIVITHDVSQILPNEYVYILEKARVVQEGYRKSIEAITHSPFQEFLASAKQEHKGKIVSKAASDRDSSDPFQEENSILYSESRDSHFLSNSTESVHNIQDPLDMYLTEKGDIELSHMPAIFTSQGATGSSRYSTRLPPTASPFWKTIPPPLPSPKQTGSGGTPDTYSLFSPSWLRSDTPEPPRSICSEDMEELIDYTAQTAVDSRLRGRWAYGQNSRRSRPSQTIDTLAQRRAKHRLKPLRNWLRGNSVSSNVLTLKQILATVWPKINWRSQLLLIVAFCTSLVHAGATPLFSWIFSRLLSTFFLTDDRHRKSLIYSLSILGVSATDALASFTFHFLGEQVAQTWANGTRLEAMKRILDQPREFFDQEQNNPARLAETLDHFAEEMRNILGRFVGILLVIALMMGISIIWSFESCWKLTLVCLACGPFMYAITASFQTITGKWEGLANDADEIVGEILNETFTNIRTVRSLTLEDFFHKKYFAATNSALKIGLKRALYCGIFFGLSDSAIIFITALLFWYGAKLTTSGQFTVAEIIQTFSMLLLSMAYVTGTIAYVPQIGASKDAATRLLRLARLPHASHEDIGSTRIPSIGDIVLHDLNFTYPSRPDQPVLTNVNLTIPAGSCIAIVGASGSGKSTIASLLLNLYSTSSGRTCSGHRATTPEITFSGRDIHRIHTPTLRSLISIVSQTPVIFPGTVAENIAYGLHASSPYATITSIRAAAAVAVIDDFIETLPQGYDTVIGEGGMGLSGGQAQRIAIARALVRRPNVLILDEATSALDMESAGIIRDSIQRLVQDRRSVATGESNKSAMRHGMTVIIITHAKEMMAIADNVIMLDQGRVIEEGPYEELTRRNGMFARLLRGGEWEAGEGNGMEDAESSSR